MRRLALALAELAGRRGARCSITAGESRASSSKAAAPGRRNSGGRAHRRGRGRVITAMSARSPPGCSARDASAPSTRRAGRRSLSALTLALLATRRRLRPGATTTCSSATTTRRIRRDPGAANGCRAIPPIYVCAQDRDDRRRLAAPARAAVLLVNAPPLGGSGAFAHRRLDACEQATFRRLDQLGLSDPSARARRGRGQVRRNSRRCFPRQRGALYGRASHGWTASFARAGARTRLPGLYLAGGSVHPGPGVPMAALSGALAATAVAADLRLRSRTSRSWFPGRLRLVVCRRVERRRPLRPDADRLRRQRVLALLRTGRGRRDPSNHCAFNVALYGPRGARWAMTERGRDAVHRRPDALRDRPERDGVARRRSDDTPARNLRALAATAPWRDPSLPDRPQRADLYAGDGRPPCLASDRAPCPHRGRPRRAGSEMGRKRLLRRECRRRTVGARVSRLDLVASLARRRRRNSL